MDHMPDATADFFNNANNNSSCSHMMETCDGYTPMDPMLSTTPSVLVTPSTSGIAGLHNGVAMVTNGFCTAGGSNGPFNGHFNGNGCHVAPSTTARAIVMKKSRSLEDVRVENIDGSQPSHEMEFVSSRIQKLKVQE